MFARNRRDFAIDNCMIGWSDMQTGGVSATPRVSLFNNSQTGDSLAVYGILAKSTANPPLIFGNMFLRAQGILAGQQGPIVAGNPIIPGQITYDAPTGITDPSIFAFFGTGDFFLTLGESPLLVLPPKWQLSIWSTTAPCDIYATMIWSLY